MSDSPKPCEVRVIARPGSWIEGEAVRQLETVAKLPGMRLAVGMPDLHPGRGHPIGAAFATEGFIYPHLVGNDIGCGMGLWRLGLSRRKIKRDRWAKALSVLDEPWEGSLGTIGGGNHFAELQAVESVSDEAGLAALGVDADRLVLLVHSGSRGLGESILRDHVAEHGAKGLAIGTDDATRYLARHDEAVEWGRANRALIARRFADALGTATESVLDVCHNSVTPLELAGCACWLHRKGAAPSDKGPVVVPGSRGTFSYLLRPEGDGARSAFSLAHGAGRKWKRSDAKARIKDRYRVGELLRTSLGSTVICGDRDLLYEEAPQAYKDIDVVVGDLVAAELARVVAVLRPIITYKCGVTGV